MNRRIIALFSILIMILSLGLSGCSRTSVTDTGDKGETYKFTDSCGRKVDVPSEVTRIAASGQVSQIMLQTLAPDMLVGLAVSYSSTQEKFFDKSLWDLPTFGQFYGSKANLNMESLATADAQLIIDLGDSKDNHKHDMDTIQRQTGVPTIYIEATLDSFADAYRTLGKILGREEKAEELASYVDDVMNMAKKNSAKIPDAERQSVYYGTGSTGLTCNAEGSIQADVIDAIGARNAVIVPEDDITDAGGGTQLSLEQLYTCQPHNIILKMGGQYRDIQSGDKSWSDLDAVKRGRCFEIPGAPYCWMSEPPSVNRVLGVLWLGNLVYPDVYDYDMVEKAQEFYKLFYGYDLSDAEAREMLSNSTLKKGRK